LDFDYLIIGAGISGAVAVHGRALIVEMEANAGYHSTGRSAALYTPNYGPDLVRQINKLSYAFLNNPPAGFTQSPLLSPRGMLMVVPPEHAVQLKPLLEEGGDYVTQISASETLKLAPFLRPEKIHAAVYEQGVFDMDVNALHQGFLSGFKQRGGSVMYGAQVNALSRAAGAWNVRVGDSNVSAGMVINAAGAWADSIGVMAGSTNIGLQPRRRTAILVDAPAGAQLDSVPAIDFFGVENYIKPEAGQLMVSPGDETPVTAQDIQPDDFEIAELVDWLERNTLIEVNRIQHQWAGLRSFTSTGTPVVGVDPLADDFFWLAAQQRR